MFRDYILNGRGYGEVAEAMTGVQFDTGLLRPFINNKGVPCVTINTGKTKWDDKKGCYLPVRQTVPVSHLSRLGLESPVANATSLRKEEWIRLDTAVIRAARQRLRAWSDLASRNPLGGFDGMSKLTLEYEAMSDPGEAIVDMDGLADGRTDNPLFKLRSLPLPITHSDFFFSERRIAVSRNSNTPLDTTMAEAAGRRVAEVIEQTLIGTITGVSYATQTTGVTAHDGFSKVYGYTNLPSRITKTDLTAPTGANPEAVMTDVLEMIDLMQTNKFYGPYMLYTSTGYSRFLNDDYFRSGSTSAVRSVRDRLMDIEGIEDIRRLDFLTSGYQMVLVQMSPDVAQAVTGMELTTLQWDSQGGLRKNFKVMCIKAPLLRYDYNGVAAIVHATAP